VTTEADNLVRVSVVLTTAEIARVEQIARDEDRDRGRQLTRLVRMGLVAHDGLPKGGS
jgi:hypothetical protein